MSKFKLLTGGLVASLVALVMVSAPVLASTTSVDFESYATGTVNGQDGWSSLGAAGSGCAVYDHAVVNNVGAPASFGSKSLRISNAVTSGCFGDQTFSKSLTDEAGETTATNGGLSGGSKQPYFEAQFSLASKTPSAQQPGLFMSVSPDRGDGGRMSYLGFSDDPSGISVLFYDVQQPNPCTPSGCANFVATTVATSLDRSVPHTFKFVMNFVDGPSNDIVKIYVDGVLVHTGGSWEDYFRNDPEAIADQNTHTVDSLLFRTGGTAVPSVSGNGFLIDNLQLKSGPVPSTVVGPPTNKHQCKNNGWTTFNNPTFSSKKQCEKFVKAEAEGKLEMSDPSQKIKFNIANNTYGNSNHDDDEHSHHNWFNWHHHKDKKNTVEYWNYDYPGVLHYKANVSCTFINPATNEARFMFQIPAGYPGLSGLYIVAYVKEVKNGPDLYGHNATADLATATQWCQTGVGFSPAMYTVTKGKVEIE